MLADKERFDILEKELIKNGAIAQFEKEHGAITGRVMIDRTDIPADVIDELVGVNEGDALHAFECTFDFYDAVLGVVMAQNPLRVVSKMWVYPQVEGAAAPSEDWLKFFVQTLGKHIPDTGSFAVPIFALVNDYSELTLVPRVQ